MRPALLILALVLPGCLSIDFPTQEEIAAMPAPDIDMQVQQTGLDTSLRAVHALSETLCFASGSNGALFRTTDGQTWRRIPIPNADTLDFRDVHAFDQSNILLMTAGTPARIYRTSDGGETWTIVHEDHHPAAFFDAMDFWDANRGVLFGDPIDGAFTILLTDDGGRTWRKVPEEDIPPALPGEAGFAASGTCVAAGPDGRAVIVLGGETGLRGAFAVTNDSKRDADPKGARILKGEDYGETWAVDDQTHMPSRESSGLFSVAFFGSEFIAVGGDYANPLMGLTNIQTLQNDPDLLWRILASMKPYYSRHPGKHPLAKFFQVEPYRSCVAVGSLDGAPVMLSTGWASCSVASESTEYHWRIIQPIPGTYEVESSDPANPWLQHAADFPPNSSRAWVVGAEGTITRIDLSIPADASNN